jgi:hypothetical protein
MYVAPLASRITGLGGTPEAERSPTLSLKPVERITEAAITLVNDIGSSFFVGIESTLALLRGEVAAPSEVAHTPDLSPSSIEFHIEKFRPSDPHDLAESLVVEACALRGVQVRPSEISMDALARKLRPIDTAVIADAFAAALTRSRNIRVILVLDALDRRGFNVSFVRDLNFSDIGCESRVNSILDRWGLTSRDHSNDLLL